MRYDIVLPRVNSHILVSLHIENITIIDFWTSFMDNENDTTIEFSCLKKLSLEFSLYRYIDVDMPKIVLKFPELRLLTIFHIRRVSD
ncbi:hypothetical protein IWW56_003666 [Coemansia sp. RSA 2131]|nr:hypothetical protein IWW56_003666 [Coemansia sp. RSA 2131]